MATASLLTRSQIEAFLLDENWEQELTNLNKSDLLNVAHYMDLPYTSSNTMSEIKEGIIGAKRDQELDQEGSERGSQVSEGKEYDVDSKSLQMQVRLRELAIEEVRRLEIAKKAESEMEEKRAERDRIEREKERQFLRENLEIERLEKGNPDFIADS